MNGAKWGCSVTITRAEVAALDAGSYVREARYCNVRMLRAKKAGVIWATIMYREARRMAIITARSIRKAQRQEANE